MNITEYDKTKVFDSEVAPVIAQLKTLCEIHKIPMFVSCAISNTLEEGTVYSKDCIGTGSNNICLADDQITKHFCVANGFVVSPPNVVPTLDESALEYIDSDDLD